VSWYQKGKTNLNFTEARDVEWQWHQLGHMQVCTSLQTYNHASTPPLKENWFLFSASRCRHFKRLDSVRVCGYLCQVVEKCFSRDVQFVITNRQSSATLQQQQQRPSSVADAVHSPQSSVASASAGVAGIASPAVASPGEVLRVSHAAATAGVFDSSPAVPTHATCSALVSLHVYCLSVNLSHTLGQLSPASLRGRLIEYQLRLG